MQDYIDQLLSWQITRLNNEANIIGNQIVPAITLHYREYTVTLVLLVPQQPIKTKYELHSNDHWPAITCMYVIVSK